MKKIELIRTTKIPFIPIAKAITPPIIWQMIYRLLIVRNITGAEKYRPFYSPWLEAEFLSEYQKIKPYTLCPIESCWTLANMLRHAISVDGAVAEAGVFQGGTALLLKNIITQQDRSKHLYLFDSFEGMKDVDEKDNRHISGDFGDTSLDQVQSVVGADDFIIYRKGWIPESFNGLEEKSFCFVHIDLDLYQSILDCCAFVYPRLSRGGVIVFDDYGYASCPGALKAITEFFSDKPEKPLALQTGQALVYKL